MKFDLSEDQRLLQDQIARYLEREFPEARLRKAFDNDSGFDTDLWKGLMALGLGGVMVPEEYGGLGLELLDLAVISETLGYAAAPGPFLGHVLAGLAITLAGDKAQKAHWLPKLASGEVIATVALGESQNAWFPDQWQLSGTTSLMGEKRNVMNALQAKLFVVGTKGGGLVLVFDQSESLVITSPEVTDRTRRIYHMNFNGVHFEPLAGKSPGGILNTAWRVCDAGQILLSADAYGGARLMLDMSVSYAKEREQFGVAIGHFQAVKHQLADMALMIEPNFALYWYAAHAFDHIDSDRSRMASIAKAHITECYSRVCRQAIEIHGGIGYTWEHSAHIWLKRSMLDWAYLGAPTVHRARATDMAGW